MKVGELISNVYNQNTTELHLKIGSPPLIRVNKFLQKTDLPIITEKDIQDAITELMPEEEKKHLKESKLIEFSVFGNQPCNYRIQIFQVQNQYQIIIRFIASSIPTWEALSLPKCLEKITSTPSGLFIFSGPARSGISTSLAAFVEKINQVRPAHILIIEDPIEFTFENKKSFISHRQFRKDIVSVEQAINFAKRMDIDILVLGDLKKELPFKNILEFAAGGHFVIISMQTLGVQNTLEKILYTFPDFDRDYAANLMANCIVGVCSQVLLHSIKLNKMVPVHEVLIVNQIIKQILQKGKISQLEANIQSAGEGSQLFEIEVSKLIKDNIIAKDTGEGFLQYYKLGK